MTDPTTPWLRTLAQVEDKQFDARADAQYAAVVATLRARKLRRWGFGGAVGMVAVAAGVMLWVPNPASQRSANPVATAAVDYAEPPGEDGVARPSPERSRPAPVVPAEASHPPGSTPLPVETATQRRAPRKAPSKARKGDASKPSEPPGPATPFWRTQIRDGEVAAALTDMDAATWSSFLRLATAQELLVIAQAARAAKRTPRARSALNEIRDRFSEDKLADQATFLLGRVEGELASDDAAAARWFARYVREFPKGQFVDQARGRILSDLVKRGKTAEAHRAAEDYLSNHPKGAYAGLAERLAAASE